jgi:Cu(I)/Ag(I) efflux system membrane fusion protein
VFVAKGDGLFEPREVHLGQRFAERVAVTDGVSPGESVVVGAQFLIDSESQLRAALAGMGAAGEHRH